ncbi:NADP-dependent oxidoreductase [Actibacterium lipolyticum]|uniref:NADPH-dependent curcumin reductase n=1 Tax=Actibacterium lipolyticum TaxID=1524263 RepID=A0A238KNT8_9RHOB|nr:NADP-dependent oxidoreductase [Actibacterium lipolyticum]SMX44290.1 NADPH-dependent curcumin reductase [Actibacterium lipolyticum]
MADMMKQVVLASRPAGAAGLEHFRLEEVAIPTPADGEVLVRITHMSLDPYMRGRMDDAKSYATPVAVGATMEAGAVGEVIASNAPGFAPGDTAFGMLGWATHGCLPATHLRKLDPSIPATTALGVMGMPGFTGWYGLTEIGKPKAGETLVVAAATGPVGSMVGQLAKLRGLRVVGIAGGADKCKQAVETFGFDACVDHRAYDTARDLRKAIAAEAPDGVDIYFENVGGKVLEATLPLMNTFGRIPLCGMIAWYEGAETSATDQLPRVWRNVLVNRLCINGFIISDHFDRFPDFLKEVAPHVADGSITYLEDVAEGLENAPETFLRMLKGGNKGKQIVKIS